MFEISSLTHNSVFISNIRIVEEVWGQDFSSFVVLRLHSICNHKGLRTQEVLKEGFCLLKMRYLVDQADPVTGIYTTSPKYTKVYGLIGTKRHTFPQTVFLQLDLSLSSRLDQGKEVQ